MKKVLFLVKSAKTPSSRIRAVDLLPLLEQLGMQASVQYLPDSHIGRLKLFRTLGTYDIVVLQKRLLNWLEFRVLRQHSRKLAFDFDDAIYCRNASPSPRTADYVSKTRERLFKRTVRNVDLVIAANTTLANKTREYAPNTRVATVCSAVGFQETHQKQQYDLHSPAIVVWVGTKSTLRYLDFISEELRLVRSKHDFVLRVIADEAPVIEGIEVEFIPWNIETQEQYIAGSDVGIMPLSWDPFSEGKAAYKLLQYLACGLPAVCSPIGMNAEVAGDDCYALTATDGEAFAQKLSQLLEHKEIRESLGGKGPKLVAEKYSQQQVANTLHQALTNLID